MRMKLVLLSSITLLSTAPFAQDRVFSPHGSQLQMEILGPGGLVSFHFESRFLKARDGIGFRVGLGHVPYGTLEKSCNDGLLITIPIGLSYLIGKNDHVLEIGGGGVMIFGGGTKVYCAELEDNFFESGEPFYAYCLAGYRYQPISKKISLRAFISPLFQKDMPVMFWGGAGIGLTFKTTK